MYEFGLVGDGNGLAGNGLAGDFPGSVSPADDFLVCLFLSNPASSVIYTPALISVWTSISYSSCRVAEIVYKRSLTPF